MGLTIKIAAGVLIGAVAAFVAVRAPAWIQESRRATAWYEAMETVRALTPPIVMQRCGKPTRDVTEKGTNERYLYYQNRSVVVTFWRNNAGDWRLMRMHMGWLESVGDAYVPQGTRVQGSHDYQDEAFAQVAVLPCLAGKEQEK